MSSVAERRGGNFLLEPELKSLGLAPAPGM
jgi:hypothetical protein